MKKANSNHVTMPVFEKSMRSIAGSFVKIDKNFEKVFEKLDKHDAYFVKIFEQLGRHDKVFEVMLKEMQTNSQEAREHRMMMSSLNHSDVIQERRIKGLELRIEKIEEKIK